MEFKRGKFLIVNGIEFPYPSNDISYTNSTFVNSGRNANASVVAEVIGREQYKLNNLKWKVLDAATWNMMCKEFEKFYLTVQFPSMTTGEVITLEMYPSDRTATPFKLNDNDMPIYYKDCACNLIDLGR